MTELTCPYCSSDNVYYSKKRACFVCEDCEENFTQEEVSEDTKSQKLFFSYGHDENVPLVLRLKRDLEARGHQIWFDKSNIKVGDDWREDITHGLLEASEVLSFLSMPVVRSLLVFVILVEKFIIFSIKSGRIAFACLLFTSDLFFYLHQFFFKDRLLIGGNAGLEETRKEGQIL